MTLIIFDLTTNRIITFLNSGFSAPDYKGRPDVIFDADLSALKNIPQKYWIQSGGRVIEMSKPEKDQVDADEAAAIVAQNKTKTDLIASNLALQSSLTVPSEVKDFAQKLMAYWDVT